MNRMTKKRVGMVLAFSLTLTGAAAYIGIQQGNTDKTEAGCPMTGSPQWLSLASPCIPPASCRGRF